MGMYLTSKYSLLHGHTKGKWNSQEINSQNKIANVKNQINGDKTCMVNTVQI